jgi:hypothetical protein
MFMANQQPAELSQPRMGGFDDPAPFVAAQFAAILVPPLLVVLPIGRNQFDPSPLPSLAQRVGVVTPVGDHPLRLLSRPALWLGTRTSASVASASVTSAGEALSSRTPSGRPSLSTSTIHFVPLPRLVLPTASPPFSPERSCSP